MILARHEWKQGRGSLAVWTGAIAALMAVCVLIYPDMKGEMEGVGDLFASMGSFTEAFCMDRINFGTFIGFYAVECGNILGLGGAFFAALCAVTALSKEENGRTAEFLLTHPISRRRVITEKLLAVLSQIVVLNLLIFGITLLAAVAVGEEIPWKEILLLHLAYFLLQVELAGICFGISAFLRRGSTGIGLGIAAVLYFFNIIANITDEAAFLKYITPFGYADGADIITNGCLDTQLVLPGMAFALIGAAAAYIHYSRKDIR